MISYFLNPSKFNLSKHQLHTAIEVSKCCLLADENIRNWGPQCDPWWYWRPSSTPASAATPPSSMAPRGGSSPNINHSQRSAAAGRSSIFKITHPIRYNHFSLLGTCHGLTLNSVLYLHHVPTMDVSLFGRKVTKMNEWKMDCFPPLQTHIDWVQDAAWVPNLGLPRSTITSASHDGKVIIWTGQRKGEVWHEQCTLMLLLAVDRW